MDVEGQCLLISFQPENHFRAPERIGPMKFHDITLATEISSQFDIKTLGVAMHTIKDLLYYFEIPVIYIVKDRFYR